MANRKEEEITFKRLEMACQRFLHVNPVLLGGVRHDTKLQESVIRQKPLMELFPESSAAQDINTLTDRILKNLQSYGTASRRTGSSAYFREKIGNLALKVLTL